MSIFHKAIEKIRLDKSFSDFHVKGFDYLCLEFGPDYVAKLYFFDGDLAGLPELVVPHDHRYNFYSTCIAGSATNVEYRETCKDTVGDFPSATYNRMKWQTPLNGGSGFSWDKEVTLAQTGRYNYEAGQRWPTKHHEIHTLKIEREGTILLLEQGRDVVPVGEPTRAYSPITSGVDPTLPDTSGLYNQMSEDRAILRLQQYAHSLQKLGIW